MKKTLLASAAILVIGTVSAFAAEKEFPAKLVSQAVLPANTIIKAPDDAPEYLKTSAKFTTPDRKRAEGLGTVPGKDGVRTTGLSMPFDGQAMQGFSGIKTMEDRTFWSLSDNGFGSKSNSSDSMLMLHHISFDWDAGKVNALETVFLSDPDKKAPFPIVMEGSDKRYLTGADFDVESIQPVADGFWVGEEFGPYILKFTRHGKLTDVVSTKAGDIDVKSPDHPTLSLPGNPTQKMPAFNLKRSGGYEGLAMSKDGSKLYGLLEGPLYNAEGQVEKTEDGATGLRIIELDVASKAWTGRTWLYPLAEGGEAIGDFNMLDETTALVIERDNGAGMADKACADPKKPEANCFAVPAKLKRIYKIEMNDANVGKAARKIGYIDLMKIADPDNKAHQGSANGTYTMPFVTIENVDRVDATHIIVGNDNNLPFSAGRALDKADDNEFVLLEVKDLLDAK
ncbi:esterase-like activity of phytase family protein [Agrobacterium rosae]|uniref:Esterase-like activity of phytase family protein n=1 Tax=Agrobacterium rosae TaxID=1972867 RepID=A0AAE5RXQ7_9HYPH|nr:esterase-like activity of phytase family protein [Agrobacterium rosae]KAA3514573.1 glycerophosphodiester phosphodiesterase [Agrobacterium rosae]KAA3523236.1 glycerophosphodiester phosphodiesterase [Agrobacterium rosae]MCM2433425.1 esterase-like activity of phytase family protein [Agrobacterium rosae]MDX8330023.1 esterase-like activity of phytase family protein [Agrobacterium rosae]MQB47983.1 glycerophosphodiester phosphodiesterase [Agrobacterium rosae]